MVGWWFSCLDIVPFVFSIGIAARVSLRIHICDVALRSPAVMVAFSPGALVMGLVADSVESVDGLGGTTGSFRLGARLAYFGTTHIRDRPPVPSPVEYEPPTIALVCRNAGWDRAVPMVFISESWLTRRLLALPFSLRTDPRLTATGLVLEYRVRDAIDWIVGAHSDDSPGGETATQNGC